MAAETEKIENPLTEAPGILGEQVFGLVDVIIISGLAVLAVYWFFLRKKEEYDSIKTFSIEPNAYSVSNTSFISKMKSTGRSIIVFYGSQTGTAEEFATRLAKEAYRYRLKAMVADPEEYDMDDLGKVAEIENSLAIFCMATYGEGDPTDNAQDFNEWLKAGEADLSGLNYAVFGLGNKTYEHYNSMGIYLDSRLAELGATRVFELGLGDDDANIEEDFITWKERFWGAVCEHFNIESLGEDINLRQYQLVLYDEPPANVFTGEIARINSYMNQKPPFELKNPFLSSIVVNRELYRGERSCMHIELDISGAKMKYETGDHVAIYPTNDPALVEKIGKLLDADLDTVFSLNNLDEDSSKKHPFPCPTTYRTALSHYVDITSIPRTHVLKEISEYASDEEDKKKLKMMATSTEEGKHLYLSWVVKDHRSIIHILEDLPSLKPPLDHLLELLPRLQARYYSISSSPKLYPSSVHITAVLVEYETPTKRKNRGVCTGWLKTLQVTNESNPSKVPIFIRRSQFRLPSKSSTPIIMIGPGTGLAPFRGFIQERDSQRKEGKPMGETILYFGCRKQAEDFLYEEELKKYHVDGTLTKLYLAFSRDQQEKVYVTHLLQKNKEEIWKVIGDQNGHIYVCGDARNMAKDVHNIILDVIQEFGKKSKSDAEAFIKKMESQRRYSADVWS